MDVDCNYCGKPAKLVKGVEIYCGNAKLADKNFWECLPCGAHVSCHGDSDIPKGTLAKDELRKARCNAHFWFDQLWIDNKRTRNDAYLLIRRHFHLTIFEAHIGMFTIAECAKVVEVCKIQVNREGELCRQLLKN